MKKLFSLIIIICIVGACGTYLPFRTLYLSPPPDALYNAGIIIVKDMGFFITNESKEPTMTIVGWSYPSFKAEKKDEISGEIISIHLYFERKGVDTVTGIGINQQHPNMLNLEKIRNEIESRLRTIK